MILKGEKFTVGKPSGFTAKGFVVIKNAETNRVFYAFYKEGLIEFNLPKGEYISMTDIERKPTMFKFSFPSKRKRDRFDNKPLKKVKIHVIENNPNKCSIQLESGNIYIDRNFKNTVDEITLKFVLYHELGHYFYISEQMCDEYAQHRLLREGYNISQVMYATSNALSSFNPRVGECENLLKKTYVK